MMEQAGLKYVGLLIKKNYYFTQKKTMRYDQHSLQQLVLNLDGTPAKRHTAASTMQNPVTESFMVKQAFRQALDGVFIDEQPTREKPEGNVTLKQKILRFEIAKKVWHCDEKGIELDLDEITELRLCVGKTFVNPETYGFLAAIIEGKDTGIKPVE